MSEHGVKVTFLFRLDGEHKQQEVEAAVEAECADLENKVLKALGEVRQ